MVHREGNENAKSGFKMSVSVQLGERGRFP